eukprot:763330-Hanusia_phi.AAC.2
MPYRNRPVNTAADRADSQDFSSCAGRQRSGIIPHGRGSNGRWRNGEEDMEEESQKSSLSATWTALLSPQFPARGWWRSLQQDCSSHRPEVHDHQDRDDDLEAGLCIVIIYFSTAFTSNSQC